jgi:hypothetical protein
MEGDASSGNEKWDIPCDISKAADLTVNVHWINGDTSCTGGVPCMIFDSIYRKEGTGAVTEYDFPAVCDVSDTNCPNYPMSSPAFSSFMLGIQNQLYARNTGVAGTSPLTTTRNTSFIRVGVDEGFGTRNSAAYVINGAVATPTASPVAGTYTGAQSVTLSTSTGGATIRYTTTGITPTCSSGIIYSGPITVASSLTIQAIGCEGGFADSSVLSAAYTINYTFTLTNTNGSVSGTNCASSTYASGTAIGPCTATPNAGYVFAGWSGTGSCSAASGTGTASCTLNATSSLTASFTASGTPNVSISGKAVLSGKVGVQ